MGRLASIVAAISLTVSPLVVSAESAHTQCPRGYEAGLEGCVTKIGKQVAIVVSGVCVHAPQTEIIARGILSINGAPDTPFSSPGSNCLMAVHRAMVKVLESDSSHQKKPIPGTK